MNDKIEISKEEYSEFLIFSKNKKLQEKELELEKSKKKIFSLQKKLSEEKENLKFLKEEINELNIK